MSRLRHGNVVALLGVCSRDEPRCAVLEYARCGDLATFLRSHGAPAAVTDLAAGDDLSAARTKLR